MTDHALVDPGSASPRMRCIGGRASSGNSQGICELCTRCYDSISFGFILVSFHFIFPQPSRECHPSTTTTHVCLLDREHPNWSWSPALHVTAPRNQKRPSSSSQGKGRLPASSSTPSCSEGGNFAPLFQWFDSSESNSGTTDFCFSLRRERSEKKKKLRLKWGIRLSSLQASHDE